MEKLIGMSIRASDGEIGKVKDVYFDDHRWGARYLVVDTGGRLAGPKVLISAISVASIDWEKSVVQIGLTRQQVEASPPIDTDKPVSRQHEVDFLGYYGYPSYWGGPFMWGTTSYPYPMSPTAALPPVNEALGERARAPGDPHLRSAMEVIGYHLQTTNALMGHVRPSGGQRELGHTLHRRRYAQLVARQARGDFARVDHAGGLGGKTRDRRRCARCGAGRPRIPPRYGFLARARNKPISALSAPKLLAADPGIMNPSASNSRLGSEFDAFLFAPIGEDRNGLPLSIVSLLARMDLDPWQEAARLASLPMEAAAQKLASLLLPVPCLKPADAPTMATRLIALLPRRTDRAGRALGMVRVGDRVQPRILTNAILFAIWLIWLLGMMSLTARHDAPAQADIAHALAPPTTSAQTPPTPSAN
ncbi:MAG: PRC-barrel domain-containing protein [Steroidobacteraceae bacterium]